MLDALSPHKAGQATQASIVAGVRHPIGAFESVSPGIVDDRGQRIVPMDLRERIHRRSW